MGFLVFHHTQYVKVNDFLLNGFQEMLLFINALVKPVRLLSEMKDKSIDLIENPLTAFTGNLRYT